MICRVTTNIKLLIDNGKISRNALNDVIRQSKDLCLKVEYPFLKMGIRNINSFNDIFLSVTMKLQQTNSGDVCHI